jgi:hypothetical protein
MFEKIVVSGGVYVGEDRRGKHAPHNKTTKTALDWVRKHIASFPLHFHS